MVDLKNRAFGLPPLALASMVIPEQHVLSDERKDSFGVRLKINPDEKSFDLMSQRAGLVRCYFFSDFPILRSMEFTFASILFGFPFLSSTDMVVIARSPAFMTAP